MASTATMKILFMTGNRVLNQSLCVCVRQSIPGAECSESSDGNVFLLLEKQRPDILVLQAHSGPTPDPLPLLRSQYPDTKIFLLVPRDYPDELKAAHVRDGIEGYIQDDSPLETLCYALKTVNMGQIWAERDILSLVLKSFVVQRETGVLNQREREVLAMLCDGRRNKEIASGLCISEKTVKTHLGNIFKKLGVKSRMEAANKFNAGCR